MRETGEVAVLGLHGDKLYQQRARNAMPLLVRQARAEQPIRYGELAEELGMSNPRTLNYPLGAIGNALLDLAVSWKREIPPLQALVINKDTEMPGEGIAWFAPDAARFRSASTKQKREIVNAMLSKIYAFEHWDAVLRHFGLTPAISLNTAQLLANHGDAMAGESEAHRTFKEFVAWNPGVVGLPRSCAPGEIEFRFVSGDAIDVLFRRGNEWIGIEVKAVHSSMVDLQRGLFQCVKYRALLEATQMVEQRPIICRTMLVLEGTLPMELLSLRNTLGVKVKDGVRRRAPSTLR